MVARKPPLIKVAIAVLIRVENYFWLGEKYLWNKDENVAIFTIHKNIEMAESHLFEMVIVHHGRSPNQCNLLRYFQ